MSLVDRLHPSFMGQRSMGLGISWLTRVCDCSIQSNWISWQLGGVRYELDLAWAYFCEWLTTYELWIISTILSGKDNHCSTKAKAFDMLKNLLFVATVWPIISFLYEAKGLCIIHTQCDFIFSREAYQSVTFGDCHCSIQGIWIFDKLSEGRWELELAWACFHFKWLTTFWQRFVLH